MTDAQYLKSWFLRPGVLLLVAAEFVVNLSRSHVMMTPSERTTMTGIIAETDPTGRWTA